MAGGVCLSDEKSIKEASRKVWAMTKDAALRLPNQIVALS
jgi:hypothetical protein